MGEEPEFFDICVVGMRFNGKTAADVTGEAVLTLIREPSNAFDSKAVLVVKGDPGRYTTLGHVSRDTQPRVPASLGHTPKGYVVHTAYAESDKAVRLILVNDYDPFA